MYKRLIPAFFGMLAFGAFSPFASGAPSLALETIVQDGLNQPLFLTHAGDSSERLFVVEQEGRVRIVRDGKVQAAPFLNIATDVLAGGERGLLGLAFHPRYRDNGRLFVNYTRKPDGATVIAEYKVSGTHADRAAASAQVLLIIEQPWANHNGGNIGHGFNGCHVLRGRSANQPESDHAGRTQLWLGERSVGGRAEYARDHEHL